ncbi:unnamed protein product [Protopolystoma xenopodis]|uniref:Uncharacterized protein n=1 Tax=Protopolystoma xenopodis TaxID=117903 RepID=A0A3S5CR69_9PLAT|nr:unnamed protein product [Protopolystoma xenopodis]
MSGYRLSIIESRDSGVSSSHQSIASDRQLSASPAFIHQASKASPPITTALNDETTSSFGGYHHHQSTNARQPTGSHQIISQQQHRRNDKTLVDNLIDLHLSDNPKVVVSEATPSPHQGSTSRRGPSGHGTTASVRICTF